MPTESGLTEQQVLEVASDIWKNIGVEAKILGKEKPEILEQILFISQQDYLAKFDEKQRLRQATSIVYTNLLESSLAEADPFEFFILDAQTPREVKTKNGMQFVASVLGIAKKIDEKREWPQGLARITLWGEHSKHALDAAEARETTVRVWARGGLQNGAWDLTGVDKTSFRERIDNGAKVNAIEFVQKFYRRIPIKDAAQNISKNPNDLRLIFATVMFARSGTAKGEKGNQFGLYRVYDDSMTRDEIAQTKGFGIMADPTMVRYDKGAKVWILGSITTKEPYGVGMNAVCVIPEIAVPLRAQGASLAPSAPGVAGDAPKGGAEQQADKFGTGW